MIDADHNELAAAAEHIASKVGPIDPDMYGLLLVHRDAPASVRTHFKAQGANEVPNDGTLIEVIDGERMTAFGFPSQTGGLRVMIMTRRTNQLIELPWGSDAKAAAVGASLIGGAK